VESPILGFYDIRPETRKIVGLHPMSYRELFWFLVYFTSVVFVNPSVAKTLQFVTSTMHFDGIDTVCIEDMVKDISHYAENLPQESG
jgi:hypothetical protein